MLKTIMFKSQTSFVGKRCIETTMSDFCLHPIDWNNPFKGVPYSMYLSESIVKSHVAWTMNSSSTHMDVAGKKSKRENDYKTIKLIIRMTNVPFWFYDEHQNLV